MPPKRRRVIHKAARAFFPDTSSESWIRALKEDPEGGEAAERFHDSLEDGDPDALEQFAEYLRESLRAYLGSLCKALADHDHWTPLAADPPKFNGDLSELLAEVEACLRDLYAVEPTTGRPRMNAKRDAIIYELKHYSEPRPNAGPEEFPWQSKERTFGQIAVKLRETGRDDMNARAVGEAYKREEKRRKDGLKKLARLVAETLKGTKV